MFFNWLFEMRYYHTYVLLKLFFSRFTIGQIHFIQASISSKLNFSSLLFFVFVMELCGNNVYFSEVESAVSDW